MKRIFGSVALAALVLFTGAASAADVNTDKGTGQLVFTWSGLDNLNIAGYQHDVGAGARYFFGQDLAARVGLRLGFNKETFEAASGGGAADPEDKESSIGLSLDIEKHKDIGISSLSPYMGVGLGFDSYSETSDDGTLVETKDTETDFSIYGLAGFELGIFNGVSVGGEYQFGFAISNAEREVDGDSLGKVKGTGFGFRTMGLHLSVAFM